MIHILSIHLHLSLFHILKRRKTVQQQQQQ